MTAFERDVPHYYPAKNLSKAQLEIFRQAKQHEGVTNPKLPTPLSTVLLPGIDKYVLSNQAVLDAVESDRVFLPDIDTPDTRELLAKISRYSSIRRATEEIKNWCYQAPDSISARWRTLLDFATFQTRNGSAKPSFYEELLSNLVPEFEIPNNAKVKVRCERHTVDFKEKADFFNILFDELSQFYQPGQENIFLIESAFPNTPTWRTVIGHFNELLPHFKSRKMTLLAAVSRTKLGHVLDPDKSEKLLLEMSQDRSNLYHFTQLDVIDALPKELNIELLYESTPVIIGKKVDNLRKAPDLATYKRAFATMMAAVMERDIYNSATISNKVATRKGSLNLYAMFGTNHATGLRKHLPYGVSAVTEISEGFLHSVHGVIQNLFVQGLPIPEILWQTAFSDSSKNRLAKGLHSGKNNTSIRLLGLV